jgi:hypothetical protein
MSEKPLTPEEQQYIFDWFDQHSMPDQDENGIDLGHLRENLKKTPSQRLECLEKAMDQLMLMRKNEIEFQCFLKTIFHLNFVRF